MQAGKLRCKATIQKATVTTDKTGDRSDANAVWEDVIRVPAAIDNLNGRELFEAQQIKAQVNTKITIRYTAEAIATRRIVDHWGNVYNIAAVIDKTNMRKELELLCVTVPVVTKG